MKIRILSDLHVDVNHMYPISLKRDGIFTVICGDTSGFLKKTRNWIRDNVDNGVFIVGNHYGYNNDLLPYQDLCKRLRRSFPLKSNVSFLQNSHKIVGDYVFVGATLWTDYELGAKSKDEIELNKMVAMHSMNDFRFCLYRYPSGIEKIITPSICIREHKKSLNYFHRICTENKEKNIIIVSHHAPSPRSISNKYRSSSVNGAYASDLTEFIKTHTNIKLWCHGHVHENNDYMIGDTRIICNPRGYELYDAPHKFDKNLIVEI